MMSIGIVDYGMGNLGSVRKSLDRIGINAVISDDISILKKCTKLILPGVGHFANAVKELNERNLWEFLKESTEIKKTPILGICLGMQLMAMHSDEGSVSGLGWFDMDVVRFKVQDNLRFKIPHIGWNSLKTFGDSPLFKGIREDDEFYFVHSFHFISAASSNVIARTTYEYPFISAIQSDNIYGVQFHPEKSYNQGETILKNFVTI